MKPGDLVKWTNPEAESLGVVVSKLEGPIFDGLLCVYWQDGKNHGSYPADHEYLELVCEGR